MGLSTDLEVARGDLPRVRLREQARAALADGEVRIDVDAFALSSNNITYAVFGDALRYWEFFPAGPPDEGDDTVWGRVPVWGFGHVVESRSTVVAEGERLYGYYPMSSELVIEAGRADARGVSDLAEHRAPMAGAYNRYQRCAADPSYRVDREDHQMLLYPLFFTAFLIDDFLDDNDDFAAEQVILSSASSKTSIGTAFCAHGRGRRTVGLTSAANAGFVEGLGVYDEVHTYDEAAALARVPSVYVDVAGNGDVLHAVHAQLAEVLRQSITVGDTHWDHQPAAPDAALPGPAPAFFFAPAQISKRSHEWGQDELDHRLGEAWGRFADWADGWIAFRHRAGADAVTEAYLALLHGSADPRDGYICSLSTHHEESAR